ncbi:hypothetical protein [Thioalkalivibrio sp. K90mix]|nr:hypothetical protein [Thioalkalivibrio sp. K90mix]
MMFIEVSGIGCASAALVMLKPPGVTVEREDQRANALAIAACQPW